MSYTVESPNTDDDRENPDQSGPLSQWTVMILCGGRGVRMGTMTQQAPKGMVPVHGQPMLDHVLNFYRRQGARRIVVCTGYLGAVIREHFRHHPPRNLNLEFSDAGQDASMLKRIWHARNRIGGRFVVAYCDTVIDLDMPALVARHQNSGDAATLVTSSIRNPFGVVQFDARGHITAFEEKPLMHYYIGCFLAGTAFLEAIDDTLLAMPDGDGLVALFHRLIQRENLGHFNHSGLQISFNTPHEHQEAEAALARYHTLEDDK